ncbi:MAG: chlorophyllide a reductase subunit Z [Anaerolineae bacterium]|nr:chlorophyllide a reductase subunit Z [Anaerolineae bacterium]
MRWAAPSVTSGCGTFLKARRPPVARVIRDLPETSSYWAAVWTACALPDVHVICDAPIGCFNLVATAVPDYTDAIPHLQNITPSVITEQEVGGSGTGPAVQRTYEGLRDEGLLDGKRLIVISTAESEMIGSDLTDLVKTFAPGSGFFHSESLSDDEWIGRDRILLWLWEQYGAAAAQAVAVEPGLVNIIGPTYGCFNSAADLHEVRRLIEGAGGRVNLVFPFESRLENIAQLGRAQVNVLLYREFGESLAEALGQPWLHAPMGMRASNAFVQRLGELLDTGPQAAAFMRQEKETTLQAVWDLWKGPQGDWFGTTSVGVVATGTYVTGLQAFLGEELGMPIVFAVNRPPRPGDLDTEALRHLLHTRPPAFVFGSINEKIYLSEGGARQTSFIPAAFPGPVVRRAVGTPFMGYRGTVYLLQEIVNRLYEALYNFLPLDSAYANQGKGTAPSPVPGNLPWQPQARAALDAALEKMPFLARISASRELQMRAEAFARQQGAAEVSLEVAQAALDQPGG